VFKGWVNPENPIKSTQKTQKKWVGLGNWVDMVYKNGKPIKIRDLLFPPYCLLARPTKIPKIPLVQIMFSEPDC
jgi:hypothetical protein